MKSERILSDNVYMAVVNRREIKILVDLVLLDVVHGKNLETGKGIALPSSYFVAGPLKDTGPIPQD